MKEKETKDKALKVGAAVKIIAGKHEGKTGELKHIRQSTGQAHVQPEEGNVLVVDVKEVAAA